MWSDYPSLNLSVENTSKKSLYVKLYCCQVYFTVLIYNTAPSQNNYELCHTIVASNECVCIRVLVLAVDVLLGLLHGNVHVSVQAC